LYRFGPLLRLLQGLFEPEVFLSSLKIDDNAPLAADVSACILTKELFPAPENSVNCGGDRLEGVMLEKARRTTAEEVLCNMGLGSARPPLATGHSPPRPALPV
jgi:hypothetical protein